MFGNSLMWTLGIYYDVQSCSAIVLSFRRIGTHIFLRKTRQYESDDNNDYCWSSKSEAFY